MESDKDRLALEQAKFRYEWVGEDVEQLSEKFGLPLMVIENAITEGNWSRKINLPVALSKKRVDDLKDLSLQVAEESRLALLVYEQSAMVKILEIKNGLMVKTEEALENPELTIDQLKRLTEIQDIMYKQTVANLNTKSAEDSATFKANNLQVNIQNTFETETETMQ